MMTVSKFFALAGCTLLVAACDGGAGGEFGGTLGDGIIVKQDVTRDYNFLGTQESHSLQEMIAGVWIDGNGCEHWIIDDGIEGYMSTRYGPDGLPYCPPENEPFTTRGFRRTRWFQSSAEANSIRNVPGQYVTVNRDGFVNGSTPPHGGDTPQVAVNPGGQQQVQYEPDLLR